jgi:hypothetical protein
MPASDPPTSGQRAALARHLIASLQTRAAAGELGGADIPVDITAVRAERLTTITAADALAEGCPPDHGHDPIAWFRRTWDHVNPRSAWRHNPWVWVIAFEIAVDGATR